MKPFRLLLLLSFTSIFIISCQKKTEIPAVSTTPAISLVDVSSYSVNEGDPLTFKISYTDGDGDIGENSSTVNNLFLVDNRINIKYEYRVQQLAPTGSNIIIQGKLDVLLNAAAITDTDTSHHSQQVTYSIYLDDRAGHRSNTVTTSAITIKRVP